MYIYIDRYINLKFLLSAINKCVSRSKFSFSNDFQLSNQMKKAVFFHQILAQIIKAKRLNIYKPDFFFDSIAHKQIASVRLVFLIISSTEKHFLFSAALKSHSVISVLPIKTAILKTLYNNFFGEQYIAVNAAYDSSFVAG